MGSMSFEPHSPIRTDRATRASRHPQRSSARVATFAVENAYALACLLGLGAVAIMLGAMRL